MSSEEFGLGNEGGRAGRDAHSSQERDEWGTRLLYISPMPKIVALFVVLLCFGVLHNPVYAEKKPPANSPCKVYFTVVEHDTETSMLNMIGLNKPQADWWAKHGSREAPGLCLMNGNAKGERVTTESADEAYVDSIVKSSPLYSVAWGEERVFVPDTNGGHYAFSALGILSVWTPSANGGKGDFVAVCPVHDTNRTILSSSSLSLLKEALEEIKKRIL